MSSESTYDLLFTASMDPTDAVDNVSRWRQAFSRDLDGMAAEASHWAEEVFGSTDKVATGIDKLKYVAVGSFAAIAAASASAFGVMYESAEKYIEVAGEIGRVSRTTGIAAQDVSLLRVAGDQLGISMESVQHGLQFFAANVSKAASGSKQTAGEFERMGITQKDLAQGQNDLWPLLMKVSDSFHGNASAAQKAELARALFGRGGMELIPILNKGSEGLEELRKKAEELGLIMSDKDVKAAKEYKLALNEMKEAVEGAEISIGRTLIPRMAEMVAFADAAVLHWKDLVRVLASSMSGDVAAVAGGLATIGAEAAKIIAEVHTAAENASKGKKDPFKSLHDANEKMMQDFSGMTSMLDEITSLMARFGTEEERVDAQTQKLGTSLDKARNHLDAMHAAGTITAENYKEQMAVFEKLGPMIEQLAATEMNALGQKHSDAIAAARRELADKIDTYATQSTEHSLAMVKKEIDYLTARYAKEKALTAEVIADIERLRVAETAKILDEEKKRADAKAAAEQKKEAEAQQRYAREIAALDKEIASMTAKVATGEDKIRADYEKTLAQFSSIKERELLIEAKTEEQRDAIRARFQALRSAAFDKETKDLQTLYNSQGWQGVFGRVFADGITRNSELSQQWASSTNRDLLAVAVTVETLKEKFQDMFTAELTGMATSITQAEEHSAKLGAALKAETKAVFESLAQQANLKAIFAAAEALVDLATGDFAGAAQQAEAAALYGSVGFAAARWAGAISSSSAASGAYIPGTPATPPPSTMAAAPTTSGIAGPSAGGTTINVYQTGVFGRDAAPLLAEINNAYVAAGGTVNASYAMKGANQIR
jgi:hypothetical protein